MCILQDEENIVIFAPGNKKTSLENNTESSSKSAAVNGCSSMTSSSSGSEKLDAELTLSTGSLPSSRPDIESSVSEKCAQVGAALETRCTESSSEKVVPATQSSLRNSLDGVSVPEVLPTSTISQLPDVSQVPPDIIQVSRHNDSPDVSLVTVNKSDPNSSPDVSQITASKSDQPRDDAEEEFVIASEGEIFACVFFSSLTP